MTSKEDDFVVIFRRYRHTKSGKVLDAHAFGLKAWPIRVPKTR